MSDFLSNLPSSMYMVNSADTTALDDEHDKIMRECDILCQKTDDPETTPYASKYKAREHLDNLTKKLEATKAIAQVEHNKELTNKMGVKIASIQVRLGIIAWECEEPHNTQIELELAASYYCPDVLNSINTMTASGPEDESNASDTDYSNIENELKISLSSLSEVRMNIIDTMKCLNMLGILWAGRGYVKRSFLFLLCANNIYVQQVADNFNCLQLENKAIATSDEKEKMLVDELESQYTHNLFYLAQAYGNTGNVEKSCHYCIETLQRQLNAGLDSSKSALDWVKNSSSIADYYLVNKDYKNCYYALATTEKILNDRVISKYQDKEIDIDVQEIAGDICRRFARLDLTILKDASSNYIDLVYTNELQQQLEKINISNSSSDSNDSKMIELFKGVKVEDADLLVPSAILTFEAARTVFLRGVKRVETAKSVFLLDGWVSDHSDLLQDHSKFYHYLSMFETDSKRKLAMESRRLDLLLPLLHTLSRSSFEVLHKQISYELGEIYLTINDYKVDMYRSSDVNGSSSSNSSDINYHLMKNSDIVKCNNYCKGSLSMFAYFTTFYTKSRDGNSNSSSSSSSSSNYLKKIEAMPLQDMLKDPSVLVCLDPDDSLITSEEIRPFLNAYFLTSRMLQKILSNNEYTVLSLSIALNIYKFIVAYAPTLCSNKGVDLSDVFGDEYSICTEMVTLLPTKLDKLTMRK